MQLACTGLRGLPNHPQIALTKARFSCILKPSPGRSYAVAARSGKVSIANFSAAQIKCLPRVVYFIKLDCTLKTGNNLAEHGWLLKE
jgi:hypothetical protein